jgi:hypothetical protein
VQVVFTVVSATSTLFKSLYHSMKGLCTRARCKSLASFMPGALRRYARSFATFPDDCLAVLLPFRDAAVVVRLVVTRLLLGARLWCWTTRRA